jgi:long-chain acyl-CoA synthetase
MTVSIEETHRILTAAGSMFETENLQIRGIETRIWKNAPPSLRSILELSRAHGDRAFLVYEDDRLSFEEHYRAVGHLAHILVEEYGVAKGERVAIAMRNFPEWSIAFWAAAAVGATVVPLNAWWTAGELGFGLSDSGACLLFADEERVRRIDSLGRDLGIRGIIAARCEQDPPAPARRFEDVIGTPPSTASLPEVEIDPEDDATIFYTSGTSGRPKGALGTHRNICSNVMSLFFAQARAALRRGAEIAGSRTNAPQGSSLLSVPFFHATGCHSVLAATAAVGNRLVMMYKWDPERALELIERERISQFGGVPAMVWQVLESPSFRKRDLSSVTSIGYGGAPAPPELVARIKQEFPKVAPSNGYGLTETSSVTAFNSAEDYVRKPDSVGAPVAVCELRVVDEHGNDVPAGEVGELWIKGPNVVKGYWNDPEATAEAFTDGWLHSGDLGRIDEEGFVYIADRAKEMLIRGGENIYCVEVENALYSHPAVMDAAVIGLPHRVLGEEVTAVVQIGPGAEIGEEALKRHVATQLAAFKVPVRIELRREPLPRNAAGKILKRQLKRELMGEAAP